MTTDEKIALLALHGFRPYWYVGLNGRIKRGLADYEQSIRLEYNNCNTSASLGAYRTATWEELDMTKVSDDVIHKFLGL